MVEKDKYDNWKKKGYFKSGDLSKEPYCIVIPPPNVTGKLHLGHAWDTSIQDIIIRYKRMQGFDALWLPGMDHAGIATQAKVDKKLRSEGINPRSMSREEWLKVAWSWKEEYAENIHSQWAKLGLSLDYDKERFTLDDGLSHAVRKVFVDFSSILIVGISNNRTLSTGVDLQYCEQWVFFLYLGKVGSLCLVLTL